VKFPAGKACAAQLRQETEGSHRRVTRVRPAGDQHQVVTIEGVRPASDPLYRKRPCKKCPWRKDATGEFPAEAFRHSAETAYDMSRHVFSCHAAGVERPRICAGFLLRGAEDNLQVRLHRMIDAIGDDVSDGGHELHASYAAMAIANGVPADDPAIQPCRGAPRS